MRTYLVDRTAVLQSYYKKAQTASIATTLLYTAPGSSRAIEKGGFFRVTAYLVTSLAGSAGTCLLTISWTDTGTAKTLATSTIALATLGSKQSMNECFLVAENQTISFSTTVTGATGSPQYDLVLILERLK
jgi:hypothetical protein